MIADGNFKPPQNLCLHRTEWWPYVITRLTAFFVFDLMSVRLIWWFASSEKMTIHNTECPYWDRVSLNTNQTTPNLTEWNLQNLKACENLRTPQYKEKIYVQYIIILYVMLILILSASCLPLHVLHCGINIVVFCYFFRLKIRQSWRGWRRNICEWLKKDKC